MSREERRAYRRMTKGQDPFAPPKVPGAPQRNRPQRPKPAPARRSGATAGESGPLLGRRLTLWLLGGAFVVFLIGLSLAWNPAEGIRALLIGIAAAVVWVILVIAFAVWRRRGGLAALDEARGRSPR